MSKLLSTMPEEKKDIAAMRWLVPIRNFFAVAVASGLGSGFLPIAPGTWGTVVGVALLWYLRVVPLLVLVLLTISLGALGVWVSGITCQIFKKQDCQNVVIDEIVGVMITMIGIPITAYWLAVGFVAFRVFDVVKPPPANIFDKKLKNGLGVMLDDVVAGIYGNILLHLMILTRI